MRPAHRVPLINEPTFVKFRQPECEGLIAFTRDHRTMMRLAHSDSLRLNSAVLLDLNNFAPLGRASMAICISVGERVSRVIKLLDIKIRDTRIVNGVTPTEVFVMAENRKRHA